MLLDLVKKSGYMDYLKGFRQELLQQGKARHTINNYLQAVRDYKSYIESRYAVPFHIQFVTEEDVQYYKEYLWYIKMSKPPVINSKLSALTSFADYLVKQELLLDNPVKKVSRVKESISSKDNSRELTGDIITLRLVIYHYQVPRDIAIFELLSNTGIKVSELCALETGDLDLDAPLPSLTIRQRQTRTIVLNELTAAALKNYLQVRPQVDSPILFQGQRGRLGREAIFRIIDKYARETGVKISPQHLREHFYRELIRKGEDLQTVAQMAGYSSTTQLLRKIRNDSFPT